MTIEAELADGRILEFPDGTKPEVIQGVVKKLMGGGAPAPAAAPAQKGERTWGEAVTDLGAGAISGAGQLFQFPGQLYGLTTGAIKDKDFATTGMQGVGKEMQDYAKTLKSVELKRREAETQKKVREAEQTGGQWAAFKTQLYESGTDPMQLGAFLAEQVPASLPSIIAALIPGVGPAAAAEVKVLQAAAQAATTVAAKQAAEQALGVALKEAAKSAVKRGTAASVGVGAVQQGTDVGAGAYKQVYDTLIAKGVPPGTSRKANHQQSPSRWCYGCSHLLAGSTLTRCTGYGACTCRRERQAWPCCWNHCRRGERIPRRDN